MRRRRLRPSHVVVAVALGVLATLVPVGAPIGPRVEPAGADTTFVFDGGGWGHGVGMSQYGLLGGAKAGRSAADMLAHYYQGTAVQTLSPASRLSNLRVRIVQAPSTVVKGSGQLLYYVNGVYCAQSPAGERVLIQATGGGGFTVRGTGGSGPPVCSGGAGATLTVAFGATSTSPGSPMHVSGTSCGGDGCRYRWGHLAVRGDGSQLNVQIEELAMEHYLRGLAEVPSSWPAAALQAQAIAGRSYAEYKALHRRSPAPDPGYDLWATTIDQAYTGYEKEAAAFGDQWVAAVNATAHQVSTHGDQVIEAFYSSSSGGHTENSENVFVAVRPYLKGVPDPWDSVAENPNHAWTRSYSGTELGSWVAADYTSIGQIVDIVISGDRGVSGRIDEANVRLVGSSATKDLTGSQFRRMVNRHVPFGRELLSTKVSIRTPAPFGSLDAVGRAPGGVRVTGWAIDPSTVEPIDVHVYVDGVGRAVIPANRSRPDVGQAYPAYGSAHGYSGRVPVPAGTHSVCVYAVGPSRSSLIRCRSVSLQANPFGSFDAASGTSGRIRLSGWAIDPDTAGAIDVHVYVDGRGAAVVRAGSSRPDVGRVYPDYGAAHGWAASIAASEGSHTACAYAINVGSGSNVLLGCRSVVVHQTPFGSLDSARSSGGGIRVSGWAIDPNTSAPIDVHLYVDGVGRGVQRADRHRPDVAAVYSGYGSAHGFDLTVPASPGRHTVCVYAINAGPGSNRLLACRAVSV